MRRINYLLGLAVLVWLVPKARAEDAFYHVELSKLNLEGLREKVGRIDWSIDHTSRLRVWVADGGEGFATPMGKLAVRSQAGKDVAGQLALPEAEKALISFTIPASEAQPEARQAFFEAKRRYYDQFAWRSTPGGAWFRHQADEARRELGNQRGRIDDWRGRRVENEFERTFDLFTGGRAVSENLKLDWALRVTAKDAQDEVATHEIRGIVIREMDWRPLIAGKQPELDSLASLIPQDQHAVFFPSFAAAVKLIDEIELSGTPLIQLAEPRSEDLGIKDRYQKQLGLSLSGVGRLLGPSVIRSVAVTGSDPYVRVGTDIAVLFEPVDAPSLKTLLAARIRLGAQAVAGTQWTEGEITGVKYSAAVSPDRAMSSYLAEVKGTIVVSNSLAQLERVILAASGREKTLDGLPEYAFFRLRYARGDMNETAFLILSDATIRRWCSPRWRIADSRRTRAAAVMSALQARHMNEIVAGVKEKRSLSIDPRVPFAGEMFLTPAGVVSKNYGSLEFMTPVCEIDMERVQRLEAEAYARWRDGYERNWRQFFDPIAARISVEERSLAVDLTVMPLILGSDYNWIIRLAANSKLPSGAADPHPAMLQAAVPIDIKSEELKQYLGWTQQDFSWVGSGASIYLEDDPFWTELLAAKDPGEFIGRNLNRLPLAVHIDSKDSAGAARFLEYGAKTIEAIIGGINRERVEREPYAYTKLIGTRKSAWVPAGFGLYFATTPDAAIVTLNEPMLNRALDRAFERDKLRAAGKPFPTTRPWLGDHLSAHVEAGFAELALGIAEQGKSRVREASWDNLPILNEWKRLYPERNPLAVHRQAWAVELACPGGGKYVWNEEWKTMESTVYGHLARPKDGPRVPPALKSLKSGDFGITFEHGGLRAKVAIQR